jgi:hypothetical protein
VPFGKGQKWASNNKVVDATLGGWQLASVSSFSSGGRLFVSTANSLPFFNIGLRPNLVSSKIRSDVSMDEYDPNDPARNAYLLRSAFANPAPGQYGSAPRALDVRGPMRIDESCALMKNTKIGERVTHQIRMEIQNPFNRVVFDKPVTDFTNAAFGRINATQIGPRNIQLGMKLIF